MKCYEHPDKEAVGTCSRCHKGLCEDSAKKTWKHLYCNRCYRGAITKSRIIFGFFALIFLTIFIAMVLAVAIGYFK